MPRAYPQVVEIPKALSREGLQVRNGHWVSFKGACPELAFSSMGCDGQALDAWLDRLCQAQCLGCGDALHLLALWEPFLQMEPLIVAFGGGNFLKSLFSTWRVRDTGFQGCFLGRQGGNHNKVYGSLFLFLIMGIHLPRLLGVRERRASAAECQ